MVESVLTAWISTESVAESRYQRLDACIISQSLIASEFHNRRFIPIRLTDRPCSGLSLENVLIMSGYGACPRAGLLTSLSYLLPIPQIPSKKTRPQLTGGVLRHFLRIFNLSVMAS